MRSRHRHLTLANSGALACWDSRSLTDPDGTSLTAWPSRVGTLSANRATNAATVKTGIQGGQPIVRYGSGTASSDTASNNVTQNKSGIFIVAVASSGSASASGYQQIIRSRAGANNDRCALYLRQSKVEAGGRRLDANTYQFVQSGTTSNNVFTICSGLWDWGNANLYAYELGIETSRSGGFQTSGNSSDTASIIEIGAANGTQQQLLGDVGLAAFVESTSATLRRRFEHSAAYSFKIACN